MITGMDRLTAATAGKKSDRIPIFCNLIDQGARELGVSIETYFSRGEYVAEAQLSMREKYGYDNVWSLFYVGREAEILGCETILYAQDGPPNVGAPLLQTYEDVETLVIPENLAEHPKFAEPLKCLNLLKREVGGTYPICAYITSTMTLPILLMGMDKWFELLFTGPEEVKKRLLDKCFAFFVKEVACYREAGADILVYSNPFGSTDTVPVPYFKSHVLPWIQKEIQAVGPEGLVYYCGTSRFTRLLDILLNGTNFASFYISPLDDIGEAGNIVGDRGLICGSINDIRLLEWTPDEVRNEVRRLIHAGMKGKKFLFGTGLMPWNIPEENIRTMVASACEFGTFR